MDYTYKTQGVCSSEIKFSINNGIVSNINFVNGCAGNLGGISRLCDGQKAEDIIKKLEGVECGRKATSCPDQFSKAIKKALESEE